MRTRTNLFATFLVLVSVVSAPAFSGEYCWSETITLVIVHEDGNVYFTTNKSCPGWCRINPAWSGDRRKEAYAMLVAARVSGNPMSFFWNEHSTSCGGAVPGSAWPLAIIL